MGVVGSYGPKSFVVSNKKIYTVSDINLSSSIEFEDKENGKGIPIKRKKKENGEEITVNIKLVSQCCSVMDEFYSWKRLKAKAVPYYFLLGNRKLSDHKLVITNVSLSEIKSGAGKAIISSATLAVTFVETGSGKGTNSGKKATKEKKKLAAKATRNCKKTKKRVCKYANTKSG